MKWIPGGSYELGSEEFYPEEGPVHQVTVEGFWMDDGPVTNAQYRAFVAATGYLTLAERHPDPDLYPGVDPAWLVPGALVFTPPPRPVSLDDPRNWWTYVQGACWWQPEGPGSSIEGREEHPVVHIAFEDAGAYAEWAGKSLPTEAEWEVAARGGLDGAAYVWGDEFTPGGRHMANTWQGDFPHENLAQDGFKRTSTVGAFPPNGYGLFDMVGNVWEWTVDEYRSTRSAQGGACCTVARSRSGEIPQKVVKGGSHLCAPNYCLRYRPAARQGQAVDTATSHLGFRCIRREPGSEQPRGSND